MKRIIILMGMLLLSSLTVFAERQVGLTLYNTIVGARMLSNQVLGTSNSMNYNLSEFDAHLTASPGMVYENNFQSDALVDVYFSRPYSTNVLNFTIREGFIDLLFYDSLSLKGGFIKTDYGFGNNYFHPMNVSEFVPEFRDLYGKISLGLADQGFRGVPSLRVKYTLPDLAEGLKIGLDQGLIWFDLDHLDKEYLISSLNVVYGNISAGALLGYRPDSFNGSNDNRKPVAGFDWSLALPFRNMLLWEGVYRPESYRYTIIDGSLTNKRVANFFSQSIRLEGSQEEPLFKNTISYYCEYFYNDEGMDQQGYDQAYQFITNRPYPLNLDAYSKLIITERNFKNYVTLGGGYTLPKQNLSFSYQAIGEIESGVWSHTVIVGKSFNSVTIGGQVIYRPQTDEKYRLIYQANDLAAAFSVSMEL